MNEIADRLDGAKRRLQADSAPAREQLLTARDVADRLGLTAETILRYVRAGDLPAIKLPGGAVRVKASKLDEWLAERER
jgi:excisionase family DNA binding protein